MPDPVLPRDRMIDAIAPKPTRLPPLEYPDPPKSATSQTVRKVVKVVKKPKPKPVQVRALVAVDDQYKARVTFSEAFGSDAGKTWSEPLQINDPVAAANKEFYWRVDVDQYRVDPLLQGFATRWDILTTGWTFVDGLGATIYDEAISNPLVICRVIKAPASISVGPRFRVVVVTKYRP